MQSALPTSCLHPSLHVCKCGRQNKTSVILFKVKLNTDLFCLFILFSLFFLTARCPGSVTHSEPSPTDMADLSTTPPRILQLHHPIQFIAIPDTPGYPIVQTLSFSPPVIGLPIPNSAATPTYILGKLSSHFLVFWGRGVGVHTLLLKRTVFSFVNIVSVFIDRQVLSKGSESFV